MIRGLKREEIWRGDVWRKGGSLSLYWGRYIYVEGRRGMEKKGFGKGL